MNTPPSSDKTGEKRIYVCQSGLPLSFQLEWPFHKSTSGADFWVLHADIALENAQGLHAPVSVNLSATVFEVMPSLEPKDIEAPVINALRKEVDKKQIEFLKSGKRVPVQFSSRYYDFKRSKWVFGKATDEALALMIARKVYWRRSGVGGGSHRSALRGKLRRSCVGGGAETAKPGVDDAGRGVGFGKRVPDGPGGKI